MGQKKQFLFKEFLSIYFKKKNILFLVFLFFLSGAQAELDMSFGYSAYITHTDLEGQLNHYIDIGLDFKYHDSVDSWFYGIEAVSLFSLDESNQNYLAIPDLFFAYSKPNIFSGYNFNFVLGRQKRINNTEIQQNSEENSKKMTTESWSFMDEIWGLGLWQSRVNWDYFQSEQQGLIGSFFTIEKNKWLLTLFLSGFFLPDHTPAVDITKGEISSGSRWFIPPQSEFIIFSQRIEAFYWLQKPYLKNVILNDSIAARFRFGSHDNQWFSLAYAYKPVNQIYFKIDGGFSIDEKAVKSIIHYQSFKHSLVSLDFGLKKNILKTVFSVTQEVPRRPQVPEDWIVPVLPKTLFFSSHFELNFKKYHLPIELLNVNFLYSQFVSQKNEAVSNTGDQLELDMNINRFKLHYGFALSAYSRCFQWKNQSFSMGLSYWYSIPEKGGWLNTSLKWRISPHLILESGIDILGAYDTKKKSFFNSYRQNDRIKIKVVYVID